MEKQFTYTENQVRFLIGAFTGALIAEGLLKQEDTVKSIPIFKEFWEQYRDIEALPNQEMVKILTT